MKRLLSLFAAALAVTAITSCADDGNAVFTKKAHISMALGNDVPVAVYPGEMLSFIFTMQYKEGISSAFALADGIEIEGTRTQFSDNPENATLTFIYTPQDAYAGNTIDFAVEAVASDGVTGHYDVPVFILAAKSKIAITIPESAPDTYEVDGNDVSFPVTFTSDNVDMKSISVFKNGDEIAGLKVENLSDPRSYVLDFCYVPTLGDTGSPTLFTFEVMDVNGNLTDAYYSVSFTKAESLELDEYNGITMGLNKCPAAGQFFGAMSNTVFEANGVHEHCNDVDIVVFWSGNGSTIGPAFASPNVTNVTSIYPAATIVSLLGGTEDDIPANWAVRNETTFMELDIDADTFAGVSTVDEIRYLYENGTAPANTHVTFKKKAGSTMAFIARRYELDGTTGAAKTDPDTGAKIIATQKYGLIRVTSVPGSNTGTITFDYKIEK